MRAIVSISADLVPEKRNVLARIYPEGQRREYGFEVWLAHDDLRVSRISAALAQVGYRQWSGNGDRDFSCEYRLNLIREYQPSDFEGVEYVEFWPEPVDSVAHSDRDENGFLRLERPTLKNAERAGLDFAHTIFGHVLVLQHVRDLLDLGVFGYLMFRPTTLVTGRGTRPGRYTPIPWDQFKISKPWWELTSDLLLPMLSPSMDLRDWHGNPIRPGDYSKGCSPREGMYNHAELHYRRRDLAAVEPFDVALTFESFGPPSDSRHATIVSKRFYDFCQSKALKGRWAPVRVDEE